MCSITSSPSSCTSPACVHFAEIRLAALDGHQRRFNFQTSMARGTVEQPALMLSLEARAGCCQGLAIHLAAERAEAELEILWRREMIRGAYRPVCWVSTASAAFTRTVSPACTVTASVQDL